MTYLRGYPKNLPKIIVSHGLGSLYAFHIMSQRPGFFKANISIAPWFDLKSRPNPFSFGLMRSKMLISSKYASQQIFWPDDSYLTADFKASLLEEDKKYVYDRMTKQSFVNVLNLIDDLKIGGLDSVYSHVTDS